MRDEHLRVRRRQREQERLRRRLQAQLRRGHYVDAVRTLANLEITDDDVPLLRAHADRIGQVADAFRHVANR